MKGKVAAGLIAALLVLLASAVRFRGQEAPRAPEPPNPPAVARPEAPEPPDLPDPPEPPDPPEAPDNADLYAFTAFGQPRLGVTVSEVTADKARELKLPGEYGVVVEGVEKDSAAAKAGLEKGDVILSFGGERVRSTAQFRRLVRETPAERAVPLEIRRNGQTRTLNAKLEKGEDAFRNFHFEMPRVETPDVEIPHIEIPQFNLQVMTRGPVLGISGEDLTGQLAQYFGVKQGGGVLVREVTEGSPAQKAGLKAGDVIVRVDQTEVKTVSELRRALPHDSDQKQKVTLTVVRNRQEQTVGVELEPRERHLFPRTVESDRSLSREKLLELHTQIARQRAMIQKATQEATREIQREQHQKLEELRRQIELQKLRFREFETIRHKMPAMVTAPGDVV